VAVDPVAGLPIKEDNSFACVEKGRNPSSPSCRETSALKNLIKTVPRDTIKGFVKIKLQHDGGNAPVMATSQEVRSIGKIVSNVSSKDKARLVCRDQGRNMDLQPVGEDF
jgi:hypothetical protein